MVARHCTATSNSLSAFAVDVRYHLENTRLLRVVRSKKTGEPRCAVAFDCISLNDRVTGEAIAQAIEQAWHDAPLGLGGADLLQTEVLPDLVVATFVTHSDEIGTITGRIDVRSRPHGRTNSPRARVKRDG
jgi:hypothetical protein